MFGQPAGLHPLYLHWPAALGAILLLEKRRPRIHAPVQPQLLVELARRWRKDPTYAVRAFLSDVHRMERNAGVPYLRDDALYVRSAYSLIYLARDEEAARLMLLAYAPFIQFCRWDGPFEYLLICAFADDVTRLLYDVEGLEPAGDHEPFQWRRARNLHPPTVHAELLELADLPALPDPDLPPQDVWLHHTNLQPVSEEEYVERQRDGYPRDP